MINKECARTSAVSANSNNWLYRTDQSNYILNETYHAMERFAFTDYI